MYIYIYIRIDFILFDNNFEKWHFYHDNRFQNTSYNEFFVDSQTYKQQTKEGLKFLKTFIRVVHDFAYVYISNFYIGHFLLVC